MSTVLIGWLITLGLVGAALAADAVTDLGITKSEPISDGGFFFDGGKYVAAPYIVERRGVDIYINNVLVQPGGEYPPYDYRVSEDPGDPPPDAMPYGPPPAGVDGRDTYYARKVRYLFQHYDEQTAFNMMVEVYEKSDKLTSVTVPPDPPFQANIVDKAGVLHRMNVDVMPDHRLPPPTREAVLARAEQGRASYEKLLKRRTVALFRSGGFEVCLFGDRVADALDILLSDRSLDDKMVLLEEKNAFHAKGESDRRIVRGFQGSDQLRSRLAAVKAELAAAKAAAESTESILRSLRAEHVSSSTSQAP